MSITHFFILNFLYKYGFPEPMGSGNPYLDKKNKKNKKNMYLFFKKIKLFKCNTQITNLGLSNIYIKIKYKKIKDIRFGEP